MYKLLFLLAFLFFTSSVNAQSISTDTTTYEKVDTAASYAGGKDQWIKFLRKELKPEVPGLNGAPEGKYEVFVRFKVAKDGSLSDFKPMTKHGYGMEEEAIRAYKRSPKWQPAIKNGEYVNSYFVQRQVFFISSAK